MIVNIFEINQHLIAFVVNILLLKLISLKIFGFSWWTSPNQTGFLGDPFFRTSLLHKLELNLVKYFDAKSITFSMLALPMWDIFLPPSIIYILVNS